MESPMEIIKKAFKEVIKKKKRNSMHKTNKMKPVVEIEKEEMEVSFEKLLKKYQDNPDTFVKDFDYMIFRSTVGIINNNLSYDILRDDLINNISTLISIRPFIINNYSNNSSSQNQK